MIEDNFGIGVCERLGIWTWNELGLGISLGWHLDTFAYLWNNNTIDFSSELCYFFSLLGLFEYSVAVISTLHSTFKLMTKSKKLLSLVLYRYKPHMMEWRYYHAASVVY